MLENLVDPLISVPRLCSHGYTVTFDKHQFKVMDRNLREVSESTREPGEGGLYKLPMRVTQQENHAQAEHVDLVMDEKALFMPNLATYYGGINFKDKTERVNFFHAALGYPTVACLVAAMKSHLKLPGITAEDVLRNPPKTEATAKGHLRQHIMGVRSTKRVENHRPSAGPRVPQHVAASEGGHHEAPGIALSEGGHQEGHIVPQNATPSRVVSVRAYGEKGGGGGRGPC